MMVNDERLLDLVEVNDLIYNRSNPNYKSISKKKQVWKAIAAELQVPENVAVKRYRVLRDRFVKEKRVELLTGSEAKFRPPLMEKLEFLTPHVFNKNSQGVKVIWSGNDPIPLNQSTNMDPLNWNIETSDQDIFDGTASTDAQIAGQNSEKPPEQKVSVNYPIKRKTIEPVMNRSEDADVDEAFCDALKSFKKLCQSREERRGNEALHGFGQMIIATIEGMSSTKQTKAMMRVTEVVMQIKLEPDD